MRPAATVVVTSQETGVARETVTSEAGVFRIDGPAPGRYKVTATLAGFKETSVDEVVVAAEEIRDLDLTLETGGVQETVW